MKHLLACFSVLLLSSCATPFTSCCRPPPSLTSGPPTPDKMVGLPVVGPIVATAGQVIQGVHVTSPNGPCITVNVPNVVIRDNEIGPCGDGTNQQMLGIVSTGATNLIIAGNVIHDMSTAAYLTAGPNGLGHPFVFHRNYVYNIRGPFPRGQMIQTNGIKTGSGASRVTCNISDTMPGTRYGVNHNYSFVEDHLNMFDTKGIDDFKRVEIAYNRFRGGHPTSTSGSAINPGDGSGGGFTYSHDNIMVNVRSVGIAIVNGLNHTHDNNRIFMDNTPWEGANWGPGGCASLTASNSSCTGIISNNRVRANITTHCEGTCQVTFTNNNWADTTLTPAIFDEPWPAVCSGG